MAYLAILDNGLPSDSSGTDTHDVNLTADPDSLKEFTHTLYRKNHGVSK